MNEILWHVNMAVLGVAIAFGCACAIAKANDTIQKINSNIKARRRKYEFQHRFDKKPLAKCYCKDCSYRSRGLCDKFDRFVAEDFFCKIADPREMKGESKWV